MVPAASSKWLRLEQLVRFHDRKVAHMASALELALDDCRDQELASGHYAVIDPDGEEASRPVEGSYVIVVSHRDRTVRIELELAQYPRLRHLGSELRRAKEEATTQIRSMIESNS